MNAGIAAQRLTRFVLAAACLAALVGCQRQFTRERFDLIEPGVDDQDDVRQILGKPEFTAEDVWYYEDLERHYQAQVFFDDDGRVLTKEWMDAKRGEWQGSSPYTDERPPGEIRARHTKTRRIDED